MKDIKELRRKTDIVFLLGTGSSINELTEQQWKTINATDNLAVNNYVYHPFFVPKMNHVELKKYDFDIQKRRLEEKWDRWKKVKFIFPRERASYLSASVGHPSEAQIYTYEYAKRGDHPKQNPSVKINANFDPNGWLTKSYDSSVTLIVHILYKMGYEKIICHGLDMNNSKYFWTDMDPKIRGEVHHLYNKAHEHKDPNRPHNAAHIKDYIIDFHRRHMKPYDKGIYVSHKTTALYPALDYYEI